MGMILRFEDIDCWQESRTMVKVIYSITNDHLFSKDFGLKDQIQRAAVSTMSNIAEGFESQSNRDFIRFLFYAKRLSGEVRSQLYIACDMSYITKSEFENIQKQAVKVSKMISTFISYLSKNKVRSLES